MQQTQTKSQLVLCLENMAELHRRCRADGNGNRYGLSCSIEEFVLRHGRRFVKATAHPFGLGVPKKCFGNSRYLTAQHDDLLYVEGYAMSVDVPIPFLHGWVWDGGAGMQAIDVTTDGFTEYYGVVFHRVTSRMRRNTKNTSLLDNWQDGWPILKMTDAELTGPLWTPPVCGLDWTTDDLSREQEIVDRAVAEIAF